MNEQVQIKVNGRGIRVQVGTIVAIAIAQAGIFTFRRSVSGSARSPLCGMGICMECRVTINGLAHCRSCLTVCEEGMEVQTGD